MLPCDIEDDATSLLIADYLEPDPADPRVTAYRLRGSHLPVRQAVEQVMTDPRDRRQIAQELGVFYKALDAALAHYQQYGDAFAGEHVPQPAPVQAAPRHLPAFPWWLELFMLVALGIVASMVGIAIAVWTG